MRIEPVPSREGPWQHRGPPSVIFYDPALTDADLSALEDVAVIPVPAGSPSPVWIPGDPQPTEAHYDECRRMNPAFDGWGELL
jgi:hypothetical protein